MGDVVSERTERLYGLARRLLKIRREKDKYHDRYGRMSENLKRDMYDAETMELLDQIDIGMTNPVYDEHQWDCPEEKTRMKNRGVSL